MELNLKTLRPRVGESLEGELSCAHPVLLRLRGETMTCRPQEAGEARGSKSSEAGWLLESQSQLWMEKHFPPGEHAFSFDLPKELNPSILAPRLRTQYVLEWHDREASDSGEQRLEILPDLPNSPEPVCLVLSFSEPKDKEEASPPAAVDLEQLVLRTVPKTWLEELVPSNRHMDKILERTVRGKRLDPEELLSLRAKLYQYSRTLSTFGFSSSPPRTSRFWMSSAQLSPSESLQIWLEEGSAQEIQSVNVQLVLREWSRCQGVEHREEVLLFEVQLEDLSEAFEIHLPDTLRPSCQGRTFELGYSLEVQAQGLDFQLSGSNKLEILGKAESAEDKE